MTGRNVMTTFGPVKRADYEKEISNPVNLLLDHLLCRLHDAGGVGLLRFVADDGGATQAEKKRVAKMSLLNWEEGGLMIDTPDRRWAIAGPAPVFVPQMLAWLEQRVSASEEGKTITFRRYAESQNAADLVGEPTETVTCRIRLSFLSGGEHFLKIQLAPFATDS